MSKNPGLPEICTGCKWRTFSGTNFKDWLLAAVAIATIAGILYNYAGGRFLVDKQVAEALESIKRLTTSLDAHAQNQEQHLDWGENLILKEAVPREVLELKLQNIEQKLDAVRKAIETMNRTHDELNTMLRRVIENTSRDRSVKP